MYYKKANLSIDKITFAVLFADVDCRIGFRTAIRIACLLKQVFRVETYYYIGEKT